MESVMQSSRMLSMSSMSASSSSTLCDTKKLVGGICLGSPTQTSALPRAMAPTASEVGICEASSKMTRSNFSLFMSRYWATESGDISMQGQSLGSRVGIWSMILRTLEPRPPFEMLRFRMPISELATAASVCEGTRAASRQ